MNASMNSNVGKYFLTILGRSDCVVGRATCKEQCCKSGDSLQHELSIEASSYQYALLIGETEVNVVAWHVDENPNGMIWFQAPSTQICPVEVKTCAHQASATELFRKRGAGSG